MSYYAVRHMLLSSSDLDIVINDIRSCNPSKYLRSFLAHVKERGIDPVLIAALVRAVKESGPSIRMGSFFPSCNMHSTGGIGSLSTLLCPLLIAGTGLYVPLLSISSSIAGAIDSLTAIPGYNPYLSYEDFIAAVLKYRVAHVTHGGGAGFAKSDSMLWEERSKTGTKSCPELIAVSLLSKQAALGVLGGSIDLRVGSAGNIGTDLHAAVDCAYLIAESARVLGQRINCILTNASRLNWPKIGRIDALLSVVCILKEPKEYLRDAHVLQCINIAAYACQAAQPSIPMADWTERVKYSLTSGDAFRKFQDLLIVHGTSLVKLEELLVKATCRQIVTVRSHQDVDPLSLAIAFKRIKGLEPSMNGSLMGIHVANEEVSLFVPSEASHIKDRALAILRDLKQAAIEEHKWNQRIVLYNGTIES